MNTHIIIPGHSIDEVYLGATEKFILDLGFSEDIDAYNKYLDWRNFKKNGDIEIQIENGVVIGIACFGNCTVNGVDLIGKNPSEVYVVIGPPDVIDDPVFPGDDLEQTPHFYNKLGLTIWYAHNCVVSVCCNEICED